MADITDIDISINIQRPDEKFTLCSIMRWRGQQNTPTGKT